jgi:putative ABC transport system permease protein
MMASWLILRLAWRNLRHRPWQALLMLLILCMATTTLSMALALNQTGNGAWDRTWQATNGAHVRGTILYHQTDLPPDEALSALPVVPPEQIASARDELAALARTPGVAAAEIVPTMLTTGRIAGTELELLVWEQEPAPAAVGQPLVTTGRWLDGGDGVVLEHGLAETLRVGPGDTVTVAGLELPVAGVAQTVSAGRYPFYQPGRIWVGPATAERLRAAGVREVAATLELRLSNPDDAAGFVAAHPPDPAAQTDNVLLGFETWRQLRAASHDELTAFAVALLGIGGLLAGLCIATAAVLVAGRMAAQIQQVGTLKAVGVTPGQVTWLLLIEYLLLAGIAAAVGIPAGTQLSPLLARSAPSLYGAPEAPPIGGLRTAIVAGIAVAVVLLATVRPALRGARRSTLHALAAGVRPPRRTSRLANLAERLRAPLPAVLGLRSALRRPARTLANAAGLACSVALVVAGLALRDGLDRFLAQRDGAESAAERAVIDQLLTIVLGSAVVLLVFAAVNAIVVAIFAARDSARNHAIMRTVGATPQQTIVAFVVAQLGACLIACAIGIPLGLILFSALADEDLTPVRLPFYAYPSIVAVVVVLYALAVALPARLLARQPVTPLLANE